MPKNFQGFLVVIYNVNEASRFKKEFFTSNATMDVPASGIILTSNSFDETERRKQKFTSNDAQNYFDFPLPLDTFIINKQNYLTRVYLVKNSFMQEYKKEYDSIYGLQNKMDEAKKILLTKLTKE